MESSLAPLAQIISTPLATLAERIECCRCDRSSRGCLPDYREHQQLSVRTLRLSYTLSERVLIAFDSLENQDISMLSAIAIDTLRTLGNSIDNIASTLREFR